MKIVQFALQVNYVNTFLAFDAGSKDAFLVDCGAFEEPIKEFVEKHNLNLKYLLLTHSHYDHVDGVRDFKSSFNVPVYSGTDSYDHRISEGDTIRFGNDAIRIFATPGHTADGVSYYIAAAVFVGDAIFSGAVGGTTDRQHFEEETTHVWQKILTLPDQTVIYPGHGAPSLVVIERLYNPFFV